MHMPTAFQLKIAAIIKHLKQTLKFQNHLFRVRLDSGINGEILATTPDGTSVRIKLYQMTKTASELTTVPSSQVRSLQIPIVDDDKRQELPEIIQDLNTLYIKN